MSPTVTALLTVALLLGSKAFAQAPPATPAELVKYLTYQSDRPNAHGATKGQFMAFSCGPFLGEARDDRALTNRLVAVGDPALPAIDDALDSFEANGEKSPFASKAEWLLLAYAQIKGPSASTRLRRMIGKPILKDYAPSLDKSVALSLNLTSYVSSFRKLNEHQCKVDDTDAVTQSSRTCKPTSREIPIRSIRCDRGNEPRDVLDQLILASETGDRLLLGWGLGPQAKSALRQLSSKIPTAMGARGSDPPAMGYRFTVAGRWSEPDETLKEKKQPTIIPGDAASFELDTILYNRFGSKCETLRIVFTRIPETGWRNEKGKPVPGPTEYLIDNSNLVDLLRVTVRCATDTVNERDGK